MKKTITVAKNIPKETTIYVEMDHPGSEKTKKTRDTVANLLKQAIKPTK